MGIKSWNSLTYTQQNCVGTLYVPMTAQEIDDFLSSIGLTYEKYGMWGNKDIVLRYFRTRDNGKIIQDFKMRYYDLSYICISNSATHYDLKVKGNLRLGYYIMNNLLEKYGNFNSADELLGFKFDAKPEEIVKDIKQLITEAVNTTTLRMAKVHKKNLVKTRVQEIENEIDFAITDYAEQNAQNKIQFSTSKGSTQQTAIEYNLSKRLTGYGNCYGPCMIIRKLLNGRYSFSYKRCHTYNQEYTRWRNFKAELTSDEMTKLLKEYFDPWLNVSDKITEPNTTGLIE